MLQKLSPRLPRLLLFYHRTLSSLLPLFPILTILPRRLNALNHLAHLQILQERLVLLPSATDLYPQSRRALRILVCNRLYEVVPLDAAEILYIPDMICALRFSATNLASFLRRNSTQPSKYSFLRVPPPRSRFVREVAGSGVRKILPTAP
jgi:hypothetical protein